MPQSNRCLSNSRWLISDCHFLHRNSNCEVDLIRIFFPSSNFTLRIFTSSTFFSPFELFWIILNYLIDFLFVNFFLPFISSQNHWIFFSNFVFFFWLRNSILKFLFPLGQRQISLKCALCSSFRNKMRIESITKITITIVTIGLVR